MIIHTFRQIFSMKRLVVLALSICLSTQGFNQPIQKKLDSLFLHYYPDDEPGATIGILLSGKQVFQKGYGLADIGNKKRITDSTVFNIGSITKQFTAYGILKLASEQRLSLNDNLLKFFPQFNKKVGSAITIRELLTHSSGIRDHYDYVNTKNLNHGRDLDVLMAVEKLDSSYFQPGTQYRYSNTAYCLLGLIIEKASGMTYYDFLRENIFQPLGMVHTLVWSTGQDIPNKAYGYDTSNSAGKTFSMLDADQSVFFSTEADGGIYTTVEDYLKWVKGWQSGALFQEDLIKKARSPQFVIDRELGLSYGFGWFIKIHGMDKAVYHTGSNGGFRAIAFTLPGQDDAIVIFSNRDDIDLEKLLTEVLNILHISQKYFTKINSLVSYMFCWPNFAPCKETPLYSTSFIRN